MNLTAGCSTIALMQRILILCFAAAGLWGQSAGVGTVVRLDPALDQLIAPGAQVEKAVGGLRFSEGPLWVKNGGYLLFSDLMDNAIRKWIPDGKLTDFRKPVFSGAYPDTVQIGANGLTFNPQGRLIAAEHGNRRISRTEKDGSITVLADRYEGKRLN